MAQESRHLPFAELAAASPEAIGLLMIKSDTHAARLDDCTRLAAVSDALADGAVTAKDLQRRFPGLAPHEIARELHVPVVASDDDPLVGSIWRFAEYQARPARIVLYMRALAPLEQALAGGLGARLLGEATTRDVFVAHELYHHAEATRSDTPIARRYQATLLQLGRWRWRTGIAALSEIAAGSFSQTLLGLPCHPEVLEHVAWPPARTRQ